MVEQQVADPQLETLEAKGLIRLAALNPELEYLFRHWLVQDAAYGSLLKQERRLLHQRVGEALETLYPERTPELAGVLAIHFEQAGEPEKAVRYLALQGRYALERNAIREAYMALDRASRLLPPPGEDEPEDLRRQRLDIEFGRLRASWTSRPTDELLAEFDSLLEAAEGLGELETVAQIHTYLALILMDRAGKAGEPAVQRSLDRLAQLGEQLDDPSLGALPLALVGLNKVFIGPIREGVAALEEAIPLMVRRRDHIGAAFARGSLAIGYAQLGRFDKAEQASAEAIELARSGDVIAQLDAQIASAVVRSTRGELDDALPIAQACVAQAQEAGSTACAVMSTWVLGDVYQRQGKLEEAREVLRMGATMAPMTGSDAVLTPSIQAWLGLTLVALGVDDSEDDFELALAAARSIHNRVGEGGILWKRAQARARRRSFDEAWPDFEASAELWEDEQALPMLGRVLASWGQALRAVGRHEEGNEKLRRAIEIFDRVGIRTDAEAAHLALAGPGPIQFG